MLVAPAQAAFTSTKCLGAAGVQAAGSTLQADAQGQWNTVFNAPGNPYCPVGFTSRMAPYLSVGSGSGRQYFYNRDPNVRLVASDEPPGTVSDIPNKVYTVTQLNQGANGPGGGNDGQIRTIPNLSTSIALIVNAPTGCALSSVRPPATVDTFGRFKTSNATLEDAFYGRIANWGQLLNAAPGNPCYTKPIKRVVRLDSSGTTFQFKKWLKAVKPADCWSEIAAPPCAALANTAWPNNTGATAVLRPTVNGGNAQAALVARTPGAIGYVALPDARANGFDQTILDSRFWLRLDNGSGTFTEPSSAAANLSTKGANCATVVYTGVPGGTDPTLSNSAWQNVSGVNTRTAYAICTLSYELAWNDSSTVYGTTSTEEKRQRTVKDFVGYQLSTSGQNVLPTRDYSKLPASVLAIAQGGQQRVCWVKGVATSATCL
jgi:ABC-type phosphate transport system substrate-binding protein